MATQEQRLRWKVIPYGAQWAVTEEGTGFVILTRNTRREALEEGRLHATRAGVELIAPADDDDYDDYPGQRA
jgi:hypothetical protein